MKNRWMQWLTISLFLLFLLGCASSQNYAAAVNSWRGANVKALFDIWGFPNRVLELANGNQLYIYQLEGRQKNNTTSHMPVSDSQMTVTKGPVIFGDNSFYGLRCTTWFEIDRHRRVISGSFRGNNCITSDSSTEYMNPRKKQ